MKDEYIRILVCPVCKSSLDLRESTMNKNDVTGGSLYCPCCSYLYQVKNGIPDLLPPETDQGI